MSPEEFELQMQQIVHDWSDDLEECHLYMDSLMLDVLRSLGYDKGCDVFEHQDKWYA